jgi:hypothetical protein
MDALQGQEGRILKPADETRVISRVGVLPITGAEKAAGIDVQ